MAIDWNRVQLQAFQDSRMKLGARIKDCPKRLEPFLQAKTRILRFVFSPCSVFCL